MWFNKKVKLPQSEAEYETLLDRVMKAHGLTDRVHAAAVMSVAIRHLPPEKSITTLDYLGQYIQKNIANYVANLKSNLIKHKAQVDQMEAILKNEPNNAQARDELEKAAKEGSPDARAALDRLFPEVPQNVVPLTSA